MTFFGRAWTDGEKWLMGLAAVLIAAGAIALARSCAEGDVTLQIAGQRDMYGRCIDRELVLKNNTSSDATQIRILLDTDYFTQRGDLVAEYGDEREMLIPPGEKTLIERSPYSPVPISREKMYIIVPLLQPGQTVHLFFGGETILDAEAANARRGLLEKGQDELMDKPRVQGATRKDGKVKPSRLVACGAR